MGLNYAEDNPHDLRVSQNRGTWADPEVSHTITCPIRPVLCKSCDTIVCHHQFLDHDCCQTNSAIPRVAINMSRVCQTAQACDCGLPSPFDTTYLNNAEHQEAETRAEGSLDHVDKSITIVPHPVDDEIEDDIDLDKSRSGHKDVVAVQEYAAPHQYGALSDCI